MKRIQNKAIAGTDDPKTLAEDGESLVRVQASPAESITVPENTLEPLNDAVAAGSEEASQAPKIDRYHAARYIRDLLIELHKISKTSGVGQVAPGLDAALETAIAQANTAVNMQQ